jgi:hypothetical protein
MSSMQRHRTPAHGIAEAEPAQSGSIDEAIDEVLAGFDRAFESLPADQVVWRGMFLRVRAAIAREAGRPLLAPVEVPPAHEGGRDGS